MLEGRTLARFLSYIDRSGVCWVWTGTTTRKGYGQFSLGRRDEGSDMAHRLAWEQDHGPIPEGMQVCHRCDNPPCVNPEHLFLGSAAENQYDKRRKGRAARGERNGGGGKLTADDVRTIRANLSTGATCAAEARRTGVSRTMIYAIRDRRKWNHVD